MYPPPQWEVLFSSSQIAAYTTVCLTWKVSRIISWIMRPLSCLSLKKKTQTNKKKTIIKDNAHRYIKFPSLYCRNSINSSRSYLAMLHTKHEILKSSKLCLRSCSWKIPPLLNYKTDQKSYLSYIYRVFDTVWVKSCQSLNYNWGLTNCQIPTELKGRPTSIMVNMATEYVSTRACHSCKTRSFFIDWQRLKRLIIGQNL